MLLRILHLVINYFPYNLKLILVCNLKVPDPNDKSKSHNRKKEQNKSIINNKTCINPHLEVNNAFSIEEGWMPLTGWSGIIHVNIFLQSRLRFLHLFHGMLNENSPKFSKKFAEKPVIYNTNI